MKTKSTRNRLVPCGQTGLAATTRGTFEQSSVAYEAAPLAKLKKILVPIDFSQPSLKALQYAVPFAEKFGATISLVHVIEKASFLNDVDNVVLARADEEQIREARKRLATLAQKEIQELIPIDP